MYYTPNNYLHNSNYYIDVVKSINWLSSNGKKEIVVIGKSVKDLTEQEVDEVIQELIKTGAIIVDENNNLVVRKDNNE